MQFEKAFYTVPYRLIGERVLVLGNSQVVRIFPQEVTAHPRASTQVMRRPEHAPPQLEQYLNLTHDGLVTTRPSGWRRPAARCTSPRPAIAASRTSWFMSWTDCHRSNPRSRRTDRSSSASHVSPATSTPTTQHRLPTSQGHQHGRTPEAQEAVRHARHPQQRLSQALAEKWSYTQFLDTLLTDEAEP